MNKMVDEKFAMMNRKHEVLTSILNYVNANCDMTLVESDGGTLISVVHSNDESYAGVADVFEYGSREHQIDHMLFEFAKINRVKIIDELFKD